MQAPLFTLQCAPVRDRLRVAHLPWDTHCASSSYPRHTPENRWSPCPSGVRRGGESATGASSSSGNSVGCGPCLHDAALKESVNGAENRSSNRRVPGPFRDSDSLPGEPHDYGHLGGDGRVNRPRQYSISRGFAPIPPFYTRRRGRWLHSCALSRVGHRTGRAVQRMSLHARASPGVELPPSDAATERSNSISLQYYCNAVASH